MSMSESLLHKCTWTFKLPMPIWLWLTNNSFISFCTVVVDCSPSMYCITFHKRQLRNNIDTATWPFKSSPPVASSRMICWRTLLVPCCCREWEWKHIREAAIFLISVQSPEWTRSTSSLLVALNQMEDMKWPPNAEPNAYSLVWDIHSVEISCISINFPVHDRILKYHGYGSNREDHWHAFQSCSGANSCVSAS